MPDPPDPKFDVAISFVARDEGLASQLNDLLKDRLSTFLYSERQAEIAGKDGENTFSAVFGEQSRCVVILFRDEWGQTPWTRIEETAIRNRAHEEGYDFALFVPVEDGVQLPRWVPKNRLWIGLKRWGAQGAAAVVEARVQELGGAARPETLEDRAAREGRRIAYEKEKAIALAYEPGIKAFIGGAQAITAALEAGVQRINSSQSAVNLQYSLRGGGTYPTPFVIGLKNGFTMPWSYQYSNTPEGAKLEAVIWQGHPPSNEWFREDKPRRKASRQFVLSYSEARQYVWMDKQDPSRELAPSEVAEEMLTWYLSHGGVP